MIVDYVYRRIDMEKCKLCNNEVDSITHFAEQWLLETIKSNNPQWVETDGACQKCIDYYKSLDDISG